MFIELYDKYRVNINNIRSYYPYDETRIKMMLFKSIDDSRRDVEILMCGNKETRNRVLERLDYVCGKERMVTKHEPDKKITL